MAESSMPTKERLAQAIEQRAGDEKSGRVRRMIAKARAGHYDEFESELAFPLTQLVNDLRAVHFDDLTQRTIDGEFDASDEEADAWYQREGRFLYKAEKAAGK